MDNNIMARINEENMKLIKSSFTILVYIFNKIKSIIFKIFII